MNSANYSSEQIATLLNLKLSTAQENKDTGLEPLFFARSPQTIKYSLQTPKQSSQISFTEMSTEEFAKNEGFVWTDSLLATQQLRDMVWQNAPTKKLHTLIEECLHNPRSDLIIAKLNVKDKDGNDIDVGKGLFVDPEAKSIPPGTVLGIVAGKIADGKTQHTHVYARALENNAQNDSAFRTQLFNPYADFKSHANAFRYLQSLPSPSVVDELNINPVMKSNILTENVCLLPVIYCGVPAEIVMSARQLNPGELLGYPYGSEKIFPNGQHVFNTNNESLGYITSKNKMVPSATVKPSKTMQAPRCKPAETRKYLLPFIESPSLDGFDYQKRFIENMKQALEIFAKRFPAENSEFEFIKELKNGFNNHLDNAEQALNYLKNAWFTYKNKWSDERFMALSKEIMFNMKKFNEHQLKNNLEETIKPRFITQS